MKAARGFLLILLLISARAGASDGAPGTESLSFLVFGASGKVGRHVVEEGLDRGHLVTAVSRDPQQLPGERPGLTVTKGDLLDPESLRQLLPGHDLVVVSVRGVIGKGDSAENSVAYQGLRFLVDAMRELPQDVQPRLIHVGGSGSLVLPNGKRFGDTIPKLFIPRSLEVEIEGQIAALEFLRGVDDVRWTYITPPENFTNGERTGEFRLGGDLKLEDSQSRSRVSRADFAVALVDEAEQERFPQQRFSVAY